MDLSNAGNTYEDVFINNRLVSLQNTSNYMYAKVSEIFRYEGLPLTLPKRILEGCLTRKGAAVIYEHEGDLFVSEDLPSGKPNLYQENVEVDILHIVGHQQEILTRTIGVDAVLARNDALSIGLDPLITEFAILSAQAKITMLRNMVDLRGKYIIQAKDQNSYESALEYENAVRRGDTAIILAEEFGEMDGLVVHATPIANNPATQTTELFQYIKSDFYAELGIDINNNMKREYVSDSEIAKSSGMPLIHNMLNMRQEIVRDIKALFDVDIKVSLASEWEDEEEEDNVTQMGSEESQLGEAPSELEPEPDPDETEETAKDEEGDGSSESFGETPEDAAEVDPPGEDPEVEEITKEELVDATEALLGEEVEDDESTESNTDTDSTDTGTDAGEDEEERSDLEAEEEDDESE